MTKHIVQILFVLLLIAGCSEGQTTQPVDATDHTPSKWIKGADPKAKAAHPANKTSPTNQSHGEPLSYNTPGDAGIAPPLLVTCNRDVDECGGRTVGPVLVGPENWGKGDQIITRLCKDKDDTECIETINGHKSNSESEISTTVKIGKSYDFADENVTYTALPQHDLDFTADKLIVMDGGNLQNACPPEAKKPCTLFQLQMPNKGVWVDSDSTAVVDSPSGSIIRLSDAEFEKREKAIKALKGVEEEIAKSHGANLFTYCNPDILCSAEGSGIVTVDSYEFRSHFLLINLPKETK